MSGTNLGKMPILIVSLVIGIVMATTAIVPLVSDYSDAKTFTNEGYYQMEKLSSSDTDAYVISWAASDPDKIIVNGETVNFSSFASGSAYFQTTIIATETDLIRIGGNNTGTQLTWIQIRGGTIAYAQASSSFNASIASGTITINLDSEASPRTLAYTDVFAISTDGDYVMKKSTEAAYMNEDSMIYAIGYTSPYVYKIEGDLTSVQVSCITSQNVTISDVAINKSDVSGYLDLYSFSSITFTSTESGTDTACTYSYVIVPYEVTADPDNPDSYKALVKVIPVMAFVALIAAAAFMIYSKRD